MICIFEICVYLNVFPQLSGILKSTIFGSTVGYKPSNSFGFVGSVAGWLLRLANLLIVVLPPSIGCCCGWVWAVSGSPVEHIFALELQSFFCTLTSQLKSSWEAHLSLRICVCAMGSRACRSSTADSMAVEMMASWICLQSPPWR